MYSLCSPVWLNCSDRAAPLISSLTSIPRSPCNIASDGLAWEWQCGQLTKLGKLQTDGPNADPTPLLFESQATHMRSALRAWCLYRTFASHIDAFWSTSVQQTISAVISKWSLGTKLLVLLPTCDKLGHTLLFLNWLVTTDSPLFRDLKSWLRWLLNITTTWVSVPVDPRTLTLQPSTCWCQNPFTFGPTSSIFE